MWHLLWNVPLLMQCFDISVSKVFGITLTISEILLSVTVKDIVNTTTSSNFFINRASLFVLWNQILCNNLYLYCMSVTCSSHFIKLSFKGIWRVFCAILSPSFSRRNKFLTHSSCYWRVYRPLFSRLSTIFLAARLIVYNPSVQWANQMSKNATSDSVIKTHFIQKKSNIASNF